MTDAWEDLGGRLRHSPLNRSPAAPRQDRPSRRPPSARRYELACQVLGPIIADMRRREEEAREERRRRIFQEGD